jgi:hypothetical protein
MPGKSKQPKIPLPKSWGTHVISAVLHAIALAQYALTYSRSWAADSTNQGVRLKAENDRLEQGLPSRPGTPSGFGAGAVVLQHQALTHQLPCTQDGVLSRLETQAMSGGRLLAESRDVFSAAIIAPAKDTTDRPTWISVANSRDGIIVFPGLLLIAHNLKRQLSPDDSIPASIVSISLLEWALCGCVVPRPDLSS